MEPDNETASGTPDIRVLAKGDSVIAVYLRSAGEVKVRLGSGRYSVQWYNPRTGGALLNAAITNIQGPGEKTIGTPPADINKDWVALLRRR